MPTAQELQEQGVGLFQRKEYEAAGRLFHQALDAYRAENSMDMVAEMQTNIGLVHRALQEFQQAIDIMGQALQTFQSMGDELRTAQVLGNLGGVYAALGDNEQALNCYRQAADLFEALGEKKFHGETLIAMADLQVRGGKLMVGAATYEVGLEQLPELNASQKMLKGLLGIRNRLVGGG